MKTWVALFRGINVGGNNILQMATLRADLAALQLADVQTYIQSGNAVFSSDAGSRTSLTTEIARRIEEQHGFRPAILLMSLDHLRASVEANPFPSAVSEPKTLHFFFLARPSRNPDVEALDQLKAPTEEYRITERVFYLHAPDGIGRSKLAANAEKHLGVTATARNYRTVEKLLSMAAQG